MLAYETSTTLEQGENDPTGSFDVAVAAEDATSGSAVVWINCGYVFTDEINGSGFGRQRPAYGQHPDWMNGEENATVIESRSMSAETLTVPAT